MLLRGNLLPIAHATYAFPRGAWERENTLANTWKPAFVIPKRFCRESIAHELADNLDPRQKHSGLTLSKIAGSLIHVESKKTSISRSFFLVMKKPH